MVGPAERGVVGAAVLSLVAVCAPAGIAGAHRLHCLHCDIPFEWDDGAALPPVVEPFPEGFVLTVPVTPGATYPGDIPTLNRYAEVAAALGHCWGGALRPDDAHWRDLTLRVSFRRDGTVNGVPRVAHVSDAPDPDARQRGTASILAALPHCTPLAFSPSLGRAIAGQVFAIRFVQQRNS